MVVNRGGHIIRRFTVEEHEQLVALDLTGARICDIARKLGRRPNSIIGRLMTLARRDARLEALGDAGAL